MALHERELAAASRRCSGPGLQWRSGWLATGAAVRRAAGSGQGCAHPPPSYRRQLQSRQARAQPGSSANIDTQGVTTTSRPPSAVGPYRCSVFLRPDLRPSLLRGSPSAVRLSVRPVPSKLSSSFITLCSVAVLSRGLSARAVQSLLRRALRMVSYPSLFLLLLPSLLLLDSPLRVAFTAGEGLEEAR